jgi:hypothetical protein
VETYTEIVFYINRSLNNDLEYQLIL